MLAANYSLDSLFIRQIADKRIFIRDIYRHFGLRHIIDGISALQFVYNLGRVSQL